MELEIDINFIKIIVVFINFLLNLDKRFSCFTSLEIEFFFDTVLKLIDVIEKNPFSSMEHFFVFFV